jgi:hypothetical protein
VLSSTFVERRDERGPLKGLRDALIVAAFDLAESLRSRKVLVFLVLYVAGAIASTVIFTEVLQEIEVQLAETLLVARTDRPGSLTQALMESPQLLGILEGLVRDRELAQALVCWRRATRSRPRSRRARSASRSSAPIAARGRSGS